MANLIITGSVSGSMTFAAPTAAFERSAGNVLDALLPSGPNYLDEHHKAPGSTGRKEVAHGFWGRDIEATVYLIDSSEANVFTRYATLEGLFNQNVTLSGSLGTIASCTLRPYTTLRHPRSTGYGTYMAFLRLLIEQMRSS